MTVPPDVVPTTCDVYRPFGDGSPTYRDVPCRLVPDFARGHSPDGSSPAWTHYLVLDESADVRDGCTRALGAAQLTYGDGDEVRIPGGASGPRFVVVWVETVEAGTPRAYKRAYLLRDSA